MLGLILTILFVTLAAGILAALGTAILQGYWYDSPTDGIAWRATISGAIVGLFFAAWCGIEAKAPGKFDSFFNFTPRDTVIFDQFWSVRKSDRGTKEILYTKSRGDRGTVIYVDSDQRPWQRSLDGMMIAIIVEENGQRKRFNAELDDKGNFKSSEGRPLRYVEEGGSRYMTETALGQITPLRYGLLLGNLVWNLFHFVVWFACLWLVMQFQWQHALLLAGLAWLLFVLTIWPVVQERVRLAAGAG
jgi:hypothetical protein